MVYLRAKIVKGMQYGYLVESVWDAKRKTSRQRTLKYLGKLDDITIDDLPQKYRNDKKITEFLTSHNPINKKKKENLIKKIHLDTFNTLTTGNLNSLLEIYDKYASSFGIVEFYENILKPVMYKIGDKWEKKQLEISAEHIASNTAHDFVKIVNAKITTSTNKKKILICTPAGEFHNLGCNVLESYLGSRGYKVFNISPSLPTESIISFIKENSPNVILVSITLIDNIPSGKRLVRKIKEKVKTPIFVGGYAFSDKKSHGFGVTEVQDLNMSELASLLAKI